MRDKRMTCGICGTEHTTLDYYLDCVSKCGAKLKKEREEAENKKRLEELNSALNGVKQAKEYYEQKLNEFKEKYPIEYELNFAPICPSDCKGYCSDEENEKDNTEDISKPAKDNNMESMELSYESNGKDKPKLSARVNGKKVDDDYIKNLFENPDTRYFAKVLGIL